MDRLSDRCKRTYKVGMSGRSGAGTGKGMYGIATLMGNWAEEQWDTRALEPRPLLHSEAEKMYATTYSASIAPKSGLREGLVYQGDQLEMLSVWNGRGRVFPGHQPEVDPHMRNHTFNQWQSTTSESYSNPKCKSTEPRKFVGGKAITKEERMRHLVSHIRDRIVQRSGDQDLGFRGIRRMMKTMDTGPLGSNGRLNIRELKRGLQLYKVDVTEEEVEMVFREFDKDSSGEITMEELLTALRGPISEVRLRFVQKAYSLLDKNKNGEVTLDDIRRLYDVSQHPDVKSKKRSPDDVLRDFMRSWDINGDDMVSLAEFVDYYTDVSAGISQDSYFELMMRNTWHISGGQGAAANTSCRRVLVVHTSGRQTVEEIKDDLGIGPNDLQAMRANLEAQGINDISRIELKSMM